MKHKRTRRKRTKQKIVNLIFNIYLTINCAYCILMLILGEDIVMGNPVLRVIFDKEPCIFITCTILYGLFSFTVWLWEKSIRQRRMNRSQKTAANTRQQVKIFRPYGNRCAANFFLTSIRIRIKII